MNSDELDIREHDRHPERWSILGGSGPPPIKHGGLELHPGRHVEITSQTVAETVTGRLKAASPVLNQRKAPAPFSNADFPAPQRARTRRGQTSGSVNSRRTRLLRRGESTESVASCPAHAIAIPAATAFLVRSRHRISGRSRLLKDLRAAWGSNGSKHPGSKKEFKGIFVSAAICRSGDFNPTEKLFLGEIDSLSKYSPCRASNAHLGKRIGLSKSTADNMAADLTKRGAIVRLVFNGKVLRRIVRPDLSDKPTRNQRYIKEYERISSSGVTE
jgi:hypothetical protein